MALAKALLSLAVLLAALPAVAKDDPELLKTDSFLGSVPNVPIRGINSGGVAWVLTSIEAKLEQVGPAESGFRPAELKVDVVGLQFAPPDPRAGTRGAVAQFAATVSCVDALGQTVNVTTGGFPTTLAGDAQIRAIVQLPEVCYAPLVFVRSFAAAAGNWFAVNGF